MHLACNVKWLGLRGDDLQLISEQSMVPLKQRDLQIAKSLMSSEILQVNHPAPHIAHNFGPFIFPQGLGLSTEIVDIVQNGCLAGEL